MSDTEIFEIDEDDSKVFIPKSKNKANKNKKKAKAGMTEERKAKLLEQLSRGRATSALNRQKKAKAKKIKKQDEITEQDEIIYKDIEKKKNKKTKREMELEAQLNELKKNLESKTEKPLTPLTPEPNKQSTSEPQSEELFSDEEQPSENVKITLSKTLEELKEQSDEEIEKQIQKLQKRKKNKSKPVSTIKPESKSLQAKKFEPPRKPKAWEISHLW